MIANYHTHTRWCRHATGDIEDYIVEGIKKGLVELAITEHGPFVPNDTLRLSLDEFFDFDKELNVMVEKYKDEITIIKGMECEYFRKRQLKST